MKFDCGETWQEKRLRLSKWHRHFVLWPTRVGPRDCRWLEYIERKGEFWASWGDCGWNWQYRLLEKK